MGNMMACANINRCKTPLQCELQCARPTRQPIPEHVLAGTPPVADPTWKSLYESSASMEHFRENLSNPLLRPDDCVPIFEVQEKALKGLSYRIRMDLLKHRYWERTKVNPVSYAALMCREDRTCSERASFLDNVSEICYSLNVDRQTYPGFFGWAYHLRMFAGPCNNW